MRTVHQKLYTPNDTVNYDLCWLLVWYNVIAIEIVFVCVSQPIQNVCGAEFCVARNCDAVIDIEC